MISHDEISDLRDRIGDHWGEIGPAWSRVLPDLVARCCARWDLVPTYRFPSTFNLVCGVEGADREAVLKVCFPGTSEYWSEAAALMLAAGEGVVRVLDTWDESQAILLEWLRPGESLRPLVPDRDDDATIVAASALATFWVGDSSAESLFDTSRFCEDFAEYQTDYGRSGPIPAEMFDKGRRLFAELDSSVDKRVLLHGDLHHDNILSDGDRWIVIDPKGVVGEREFEVAAFVRNPTLELKGVTDLTRVLDRRITTLAEAARLDRDRVLGWSYTQALLAAISAAYTSNEALLRHSIRCASELEPLLR